jgi:hypothetical protein
LGGVFGGILLSLLFLLLGLGRWRGFLLLTRRVRGFLLLNRRLRVDAAARGWRVVGPTIGHGNRPGGFDGWIECDALRAEVLETGDGAAELAFVAGVVAIEQVECARFVAQSAESVELLRGVVAAAINREDGAFRVADLIVEPGGFHAADALAAPAGDGHFFDEAFLGRSFGLVFVLEGCEEFDEGASRFSFKDDGFRENAVAETIFRGGGFALRGFGAVGFGAVGAGCIAAGFGRHGDSPMPPM